mgnify:CR=1 FL=1
MEWRNCPRAPDYDVSEHGDIMRVTAGRGAQAGKVLKPYVRDDGYRMYILRVDGLSIHRRAHQLVAEAFIGAKPFPAAEVRHSDGTRTNDHFSNLSWGTSADNKADMVRHGTRMQGESHPRARLSADDVRQIFLLREDGLTQREIGLRFGVRQETVHKILAGKRWLSALAA